MMLTTRIVRQLLPCRNAALACAKSFSTQTSAAASSEEVIKLQFRAKEGSNASRQLRKAGFLPGIVYGEGVDGSTERILVAMPKREFERLYRKHWSSIDNLVFSVQIDQSEPVKVLMRDVAFNPVNDVPLSVNFLRFKPGRKVKIPVTYLNEDGSPGLKRGGYINYIHDQVECICHNENIPATLQVDVNGFHVGAKIRVDDIAFPEGIEPTLPGGSLVSKIAGRRGLAPAVEPVTVVAEVTKEKVVEKKEEEFNVWTDVF